MSVSIQDVRHALNELGKLRFGEMRVEDAMRHIVQTTHAIFSVDGAGLMLADVDHHLLNAAVSDDRMRHLEELQIRHQEGPCIAAFEDKELDPAARAAAQWVMAVRPLLVASITVRDTARVGNREKMNPMIVDEVADYSMFGNHANDRFDWGSNEGVELQRLVKEPVSVMHRLPGQTNLKIAGVSFQDTDGADDVVEHLRKT